jgi:hypothetical protein
MSIVMALPPAVADSVNNPVMIRAAHPHEIRLLPQVEKRARAFGRCLPAGGD